jgi:hypothetical protein
MLKGKCFFPLVKLINKLDIKDDLKNLMVDVTGKTEEEKNLATNEKGLDFMFLIVSKLAIAEREATEFIAVYMEKPAEDVLEMDILDIAEVLKNLFMDKRFQAFFQQTMKQMSLK